MYATRCTMLFVESAQASPNGSLFPGASLGGPFQPIYRWIGTYGRDSFWWRAAGCGRKRSREPTHWPILMRLQFHLHCGDMSWLQSERF